jgi:8-oxo-dGTP diphosphatase
MSTSTSAVRRPAVGVAVIVCRDGRVLLGRRRGSHGSGTWQFPGGHLEWGEQVFDCARREVLEETGLEIARPRQGPFTNDHFAAEEKHYVTLFVVADCPAGEPRVMEPDKCEEWRWFEWEALPQPRFLPIDHLLESGFSPWR